MEDHAYALRGAGGDYDGAPGLPAAIRLAPAPTPTPRHPTPIPPAPPDRPTPPETGPQLWNVLKQLRPQPPRNQKSPPGAGRGGARLPRHDG
ncbi:uncharacterized protein LOC130188096 [Pseudoliparis swirei]|uniref:uncharacterized protein LOC130188096 n=1 Tax=Pseudoliparis swirei TaxID=2059687 RepID=UPI0024BD9FCD|nr:uncharacterized protein LOC130188096 [Pseudoliparis swirei]